MEKISSKSFAIVPTLAVVFFSTYSLVGAVSTFLPQQGGTGTSTPPTYGQVLVGTAAGVYQLQATSTLGISSSGGSGTVSTSTVPTIGQLSYWTSNGYPSLLGSVATGTISNGTGISVTAGQSIIGSGLTITNTAPDQTVVFTNGTGISVTGTYPNFTVTNSAPQTFAYPFTPATTYGVLASATTSPLWIQNNLFASSTIYAPNIIAADTTASSTFVGGIEVGISLAGIDLYPNGILSIASSSPYAPLSVNGKIAGTVLSIDGTVATSRFAGALNIGGLTNLNGNATTSQLTVSGNTYLPLTGLLKGNGAGNALTTASNGTDFTLLSAQTCGAGSFVSALTASGGSTCTAGNAGTVTAVTGTWPIISSGGTTPNLTWGGLATTTAFSNSNLFVSNGTNGMYAVATSTATLGLGLSGSLTGIGTNSLTLATSSVYTGTTGQFPYFSGTNTLIGTSNLFIDSTGKVGVSSTTPTYSFSVGNTFGIASSTGEVICTDATNNWSGRCSPTRTLVSSIATSTGTWTGTSTPGVDSSPNFSAPFAGTIRKVRCPLNAFLGVQITINGTAVTPSYFVASSTVGVITITGNNTFALNDKILVNYGTTTTATAASGVVNGSCSLDTTETI